MNTRIPFCHDRRMWPELMPILGVEAASYWFAGVLTVTAALIVVVVMLRTSGTDDDESS